MLHAGDFATADALFTEASTLATLPALKAEALLGAGRASLGRGRLCHGQNPLPLPLSRRVASLSALNIDSA